MGLRSIAPAPVLAALCALLLGAGTPSHAVEADHDPGHASECSICHVGSQLRAGLAAAPVPLPVASEATAALPGASPLRPCVRPVRPRHARAPPSISFA